eukprot:scaffold3974_cov231-Pinguiococcus_pyrenoidosus.AAC.6
MASSGRLPEEGSEHSNDFPSVDVLGVLVSALDVRAPALDVLDPTASCDVCAAGPFVLVPTSAPASACLSATTPRIFCRRSFIFSTTERRV